jgi:N-acyl-D-amino-acid deacylase
VLFGIVPAKPASDDQLALLETIAHAGGRAIGMSHSRGISIILSFRSQLPFDALPTWQTFRALPLDEQRTALADPDVRARLVEASRNEPYPVAAGAEARRPNYRNILVLDGPLPPYASVHDVAERRGLDPVEAMIELALETDLDQLFMQPTSKFSPDDLLEVMRHPHTVMTFSDSGAHVSQIMDSSIHTHLLAYWVREQQAFTLEEAVRMITLASATAGGFRDRGLIREGMVADINVFDAATVGPTLPVVAHDLPNGAQRLKQTSTGFLATVVAGDVVIERGEHTGALSGRLLRSPST